MGHYLPICLVLLTLAGCSQFQQDARDNSYIGWYCIDNPQTGIKDCEKRLMRAGQLISDKVYERLGELRDDSVAQPGAPSSNQASPVSNPVTEVNTIEDANGFVVENQGPAPRPTRAYKVWADEGVGQSVTQPQPAAAAKPAATQAPPPRLAQQTGYTIQLAAFIQNQQCDEYIQGFVGDKAPLSIRHIFSNGEPYCVITHGYYGSLDEASQAASMLLEKNSKVDTWVRSLASLKQAETPN